MEELKKHLQHLKREAETEINKLPEVFNDITESENHNYYSGALEIINNIINYIAETENGE